MLRSKRFLEAPIPFGFLTSLLMATACGDGGGGGTEPDPSPSPVATTMTLSPTSATLQALGATRQFSATVKDQFGKTMSGASVTWTSDDPAVAQVSSSGVATAMGNGSATITAASGSASATAGVTVAQAVSSVVVTPTSHTLSAIGSTLQLAAVANDGNGNPVTGTTFTWSSSDPACASVDAGNGLVTAVGPGSVDISATASQVTGSAQILVQPAPASLQVVTGNDQTGPVDEALPVSPTVRVEDAGGTPIPDLSIQFSVTSGGGSVAPETATSDAQGLASTAWTLGPQVGAQTLSASVDGLTADFSATAEAQGSSIPEYAVLVYMAADNNRSWDGVMDIDEMEVIGSSDDLVVLVQAEFNPAETEAYSGCTSLCFNRPNFNTFRYRVADGDQVPGPDGEAEDIGNRDMTDPLQLVEFIAWAEANYPAEKYILVLWSHGEGFRGLIEDRTSATDLMTLPELRNALVVAGLDFAVIDFDMSFMGAIETVIYMDGLADYLVFSEEAQPGPGRPFTTVLQDLATNPGQSSADVAEMLVETFVDAYQGSRSSATRSAFDMSQLMSVLLSWNALGNDLANNLATHQAALAQSTDGAQAFTFPFLKDLGHWLSLVQPSLSPPPAGGPPPPDRGASELADGLQTAIADAIHANAYYSSGEYNANDVDASTGLSVLLPSPSLEDRLPEEGPGSLASYRSLFTGYGWASFLDQWSQALSELAMLDQGQDELEMLFAWEEGGSNTALDMDLWVLEPGGRLHIPYLGVVTPNGVFSPDSYTATTQFERYITRRYVERGMYHFFGHLWTDPQDYRPEADIGYRYGTGEWTWLLEAQPPTFSRVTSWMDDPQFNWQRVHDRHYTDLQAVAWWDVSASPVSEEQPVVSLADGSGHIAVGGHPSLGSPVPVPEITPAQEAFLRRLRTDQALRRRWEENRERARAAPDLAGGWPERILTLLENRGGHPEQRP